MVNRLKSLRRIEAVQRQMGRLTDLRIALADQACRDLDADKERLRTYIADEDSLGMPLAKAALRSMDATNQRHKIVEQEARQYRKQRETVRRREKVAAAMVESAAVIARRAAEDRDLAQTMESWLAAADVSLP